MGESARAEIHVPSPCERCGEPCDLEGEGEKPRLKCRACGHAFDVALVQASIGKWTVVDPDGIVRQFTTWQELIGSLPNAATPFAGAGGGGDAPTTRSTRPSSAAALLDVTPAPPSVAPGAPRLSLVPGDDPPPLPRQAVRRTEETIVDLPDEDIIPASDRAPPVVRKLSIPPPLPPGASMPPHHATATATATASAEPTAPSEPPPPPVLPPPPPPPKGGTLRTLPPPPRRDLPAPPPPTIEVESVPPSARAETSSSRPAGPSSAPSSAPPSMPPSTRSSAPSSARSTAPRSAPSSAQLRRDAEPARSRWFLPFVAVGILALGIAYVQRSSPAPESDTKPASSANAAVDPRAASGAAGSSPSASPTGAAGPPTATAPTAMAASSASSSLASSASSSSASAAVEPMPPTTGAVAERAPVGDSQLALPEVLERAAVARRSGDPAHAKALLERALVLSPGNAEAYGLLGDLARSQGDQAGAKEGYEKALATSPSYYPALLGLADTEWDLGERDAAQRHYIAINGLGRSAPERVKERARGSSSTSSTTPTTPSTASTATTPSTATTGATPGPPADETPAASP